MYSSLSLPLSQHTDASSTRLSAVLYQTQDGTDFVVAYANRGLKTSEKNYPAHKLEFWALKWSIIERFHDYLYRAKVEVLTDNFTMAKVFTTVKLDATDQGWQAELKNYFRSAYPKGKQNADADSLSRILESDFTVTLFPDVLKAEHQSSMIVLESMPFEESFER